VTHATQQPPPLPRLLQGRGTIGKGKLFAQALGLHNEAVLNPLHSVFGCDDPEWHVGKNMTFAGMHFFEEGLGELTYQLAFQGIQRFYENDPATATSAAARHADAAYLELAASIAAIRRAMPPSL
jgi:hypothetical protein